MKKAMWIGSTVAVLAAAAVIWKLDPQISANPVSTSLFPLRTPIATASFADGSSVQILQLGDGHLEDGQTTRPASRKLWGDELWESSGSSIGSDNLGLQRFKWNGEPAGLSVDPSYPYLILETRHLQANGRKIPVQRIYLEEDVREGSKHTPFSGSSAMPNAATDPSSMPDFLVQLADGHGGWINGSGPFDGDEDKEGRAIIWFKTWPRVLPTLTFRIFSPGQPPVEVQLPNLPAKPKPGWKADPLPASHDTAEFHVEVNGFYLQPRNELPPLLGVRNRFTPKLPGGLGKEQLEFKLLSMEDETGNHASQEHHPLKDDYVVSGFPLSPDAKQIRVHGRVSPTRNYSYSPSQCTILREGTISEDGKSFIPSAPFVQRLGIDEINFTIHSDTLDFELKGAFTNDQRPMIEAPHGALEQWIPVIILDQQNSSSGRASFHSHGTSGGGGTTRFDKGGSWQGTLKPRQRVRFGVTRSIPPTDVQFTFDRSQLR